MMTVFTTAILAWLILGDSLTIAEMGTILLGSFGMFMFANPSLFTSADDKASHDRSLQDAKDYPYYNLGLAIAISVTIFMALEFIAMSNLGGFVHSSWKTYSLGLLSTVFASIYLLWV